MRLLRDSGYQTLCSGKTHFYPPRARLGFEELALYEMPWQDPDHPSDYHVWLRNQTNGVVRDTAEELDSNAWLAHPWTHGEHLHPNSWTVTAAIDQLDRRDPTRPFFLQVSFHRPHPPFDPPQAFFDRFSDRPLSPVPVGDWAGDNDRPVEHVAGSVGRLPADVLDRSRRAYYAQIAHLDYQIGRLRRYLRGRHLLENTWIVFASDHGEMLGDHHMFRKTTPFEGSAHVPLIVRPPQSEDAQVGVSDAIVNLCDLMPTFLDIAGLRPPGDVEARGLLPLSRDENASWRTFIHGEHAPCWQYVTDGREKYIWNSVSGEEWLFDLETDPDECHNLASDPDAQECRDRWRRRLIDVLARRPEDRLVEDGELVSGRSLPSVRPSLETTTPDKESRMENEQQ
jgi:arylsulfatase A-like enzyme